jgi:putative tryptophan/tyrosine transport system substrate-binding protein
VPLSTSRSLARPGGNVTGLMLVVGPEIEGKRLEIFREALPGVSRVAYLGSKQEKDWEALGARAFGRPRRRSV